MHAIDSSALEQLCELIGGDRASLHELVESFIEEGSDILAEMTAALPTSDADSLRRGAHSLKSSAQDFGAADVASQAATLEARAASTWPESAADDVAALGGAFALARTDLIDWLEQDRT
jgi:HPt (histidine-containing phosphotransfer) domain-containing protein